MLWREVIDKSAAYLEGKGVEDAHTAVEYLAGRLLTRGRGALPVILDKDVSPTHLDAMRRGVARLAQGEPVQYVIGEWDFRRLTLKCDARALIPRPETEELVTRVLAYLRARDFSAPPFVADIGTGTGAIILSLAHEYAREAVFLGTDVSEGAIALARENAARTGLEGRVSFAVADGLDDFDEPETIDVIVSNPPYIASAACERLEKRVRDYEPRLALDGGAQGLDFYERYLADALNLLKKGGTVFFEIGEDQGEAVRNLMAGYGFGQIRIEKDFAGHDRYASARLED
jgi:release factor glutamine methyltransferase